MKEKLARFATQDLKAEVDYSANATALTLRNKQTSHIVAIFVFPNTFELPFNHPFFEYALENPSGKAFEIGKKIGLLTARQEQ